MRWSNVFWITEMLFSEGFLNFLCACYCSEVGECLWRVNVWYMNNYWQGAICSCEHNWNTKQQMFLKRLPPFASEPGFFLCLTWVLRLRTYVNYFFNDHLAEADKGRSSFVQFLWICSGERNCPPGASSGPGSLWSDVLRRPIWHDL